MRDRAHISGLFIGAFTFSVHVLSAAYDVSNILKTNDKNVVGKFYAPHNVCFC